MPITRRIKRTGDALVPPPVTDDEMVEDEDSPRTNGDLDATDHLRGGWGASQETIDSTSSYAQPFKPETNSQIIKILEERPYVSFRRHWIDRVGMGKRAYTCLMSVGKSCPLCDIGDKPGAVTSFNIAVIADDGEAMVKSWDCGVKITKTLQGYAQDPKIGPLNRRPLYFAVSKSAGDKKQQVQTNVNPVRERDLVEDWHTPPLSDEALEKLIARAYKPEIVELPTTKELEEIAAEMTGEDIETDDSGGGWS